MASMQILKQQNEQRMDQKQSLELVQTMLHSALSSLTFMRGLFPEKAYDEKVYEMRDNILPYNDFAEGKMPDTTTGASAPYTVVRVLQRDRSRRVNTFLDWLVSIVPLQACVTDTDIYTAKGCLRGDQVWQITCRADIRAC
jgi:hypothetical protein